MARTFPNLVALCEAQLHLAITFPTNDVYRNLTKEQARELVEHRAEILRLAIMEHGIATVLRIMRDTLKLDSSHEIDLSGQDLTSQDFKDSDLRMVNIHNCILLGANFLRTVGTPEVFAKHEINDETQVLNAANLDYIAQQQMAVRQLRRSTVHLG